MCMCFARENNSFIQQTLLECGLDFFSFCEANLSAGPHGDPVWSFGSKASSYIQ